MPHAIAPRQNSKGQDSKPYCNHYGWQWSLGQSTQHDTSFWASQRCQICTGGHGVLCPAWRKYLTLYTFSTENWSRPQEEVSGLMNLLIQTVGKELDTLLKNNIRLQIIGDLSHLPGSTQNALRQAMEKTRDNQRMTLVLAINYSGRQEILNAITRITEEVRNGQLTWHEDEHLFSKYLFTGDIPDPELLIRTSGERRISNFLLWQCAYSEFYFTDVLWPEFREEHLYQAILDYQSRERRFGLITEQLADKR